MSVRWSNLRVCGLPVVTDPTQDIDGDLEVLEGELLFINLEMKDGMLVGATGHVELQQDSEDI